MKKIFPILFLTLLLAGCKKSDGSHHAADDNRTHISLNNGEKWRVNDEMKPHIEESEKLVKAYLASGSSDHHQLASGLKAHTSRLIKSCTMKGQSHDELHKWLHPYMELQERLSETADKVEAEQLVKDINESFDTYHTHFH